MNRAGHVTSGLAAGVAAAGYLDSAPTLSSVLLGGLLTSAAALLPDLDHPNSTVTKRFGWVTATISKGLRATSAAVYKATKGPRDEQVDGTHRHLSHTVLAAAATGYGTSAGCQIAAVFHPLAGVGAVLAVLAFLTTLAAVHFGRWALAAPGTLAATVLATGDPVAEINGMAGLIGWYIALGCVVHCLGDALTEHGCPFLWPIPIRGETFYEIRLPAPLRFRTGSATESVLVVVFTAAAIGLGAVALNPELPGQILAHLRA